VRLEAGSADPGLESDPPEDDPAEDPLAWGEPVDAVGRPFASEVSPDVAALSAAADPLANVRLELELELDRTEETAADSDVVLSVLLPIEMSSTAACSDSYSSRRWNFLKLRSSESRCS
jgi:hypothetical protein